MESAPREIKSEEKQRRLVRFSETERRQLVDLARMIEWSKAHLTRAETLPVDQLPLDAYEKGILRDYRTQMAAMSKAFENLPDLRLEKASDADQRERAVENGSQVLAALQAERSWAGSSIPTLKPTGQRV